MAAHLGGKPKVLAGQDSGCMLKSSSVDIGHIHDGPTTICLGRKLGVLVEESWNHNPRLTLVDRSRHPSIMPQDCQVSSVEERQKLLIYRDT